MSHESSRQARRKLYCAGRKGGLDEAFYRWVLRGLSVKVVPVGAHRDVVRSVSTGGARCAGVVDRDALPDDVLMRQAEHVEVLPYFEVESYLVHPAVLVPALAHRGTELSADVVVSKLIGAARGCYMPAINAHLSHAPKARGKARLEQMAQQYADQLRHADALLERGNVEAVLRYFPGRKLARTLARELDFLSAHDLLEAIVRTPGLRERSRPIRDLRDELELRLSE